jgi:alkylresorcinol/alkylpyrone synthase
MDYARHRGRADTVRITRVQTAHPPLRITQEEAIAALARETGEDKRLAALARGSAIRQRAVLLAPDKLARLGGAGERSAHYWPAAADLAMEAAKGLVDGKADRVECLATSSCTGYHLPGLAVELQARLGLAEDIQRIPLTDPGCAGGVAVMSHVARHISGCAGARALAVAVELCSLSLQFDTTRGNLTSALIFGDGAGAALLETGDGPGLQILDSSSTLIPNSQHLLGFELRDTGFAPVLERDLVDLLPAHLHRAATALMTRNGLALTDITAWLVHPGGARILHQLEQCLYLPEGSTRWSWDSLAEYGNTSSAAIFDVLRRYMDDMPRVGEYAMVAAFGPGVAIELLLVRAC